MSESYSEPTNEQLARFMVVYAQTDARAADLGISAVVLEKIFDANEHHRRVCINIHKRFQQKINEYQERFIGVDPLCQYVRQNGKRCPNHSQPESSFCGLHQDEEN